MTSVRQVKTWPKGMTCGPTKSNRERDGASLTGSANWAGNDAIVPEPPGGAHRFPKQAAANLELWINGQLSELKAKPLDRLVADRYDRFRKLGQYMERPPITPTQKHAPAAG